MEEYKNLIDSFCNLQSNEKKTEIRDELQELLMVFHRLCKEKQSDVKILTHPEMNKLDDPNVSDEEFLNAIYSYIISIKESIGKYLD